MKLKNNIQKTLLLFIGLLSCSSGILAQEISEDLPDFSEVKVFNAVEVEVIPSDENSIHITGHSKDKLKFEVVENRLEIKLSLENIWADDDTFVKVYARSLETIDANEGSIVEVKQELEGSSYTFRAQEGAAIYALVNAPRISAKAITAGIVQLNGKTGDLEVEVNTGGKFFGSKLRSETAEVSTGTGGQAEVRASEYVKATAKLGGSIEIHGNPKEIDQKTSLGGKVLEKN